MVRGEGSRVVSSYATGCAMTQPAVSRVQAASSRSSGRPPCSAPWRPRPAPRPRPPPSPRRSGSTAPPRGGSCHPRAAATGQPRPRHRRYSLGFGLIDLAGQAGDASLARAARAVLQRIAGQTGETAALAVMRDGALTYVAEAVAGAIVSVTWQGRPVSMHATSTGKVLLAFSGPDEVRELLSLPRGGRLQRFTSTTITSRAALERGARADPGARVLRVPGRVRRVGLGRVRAGARRRRPSRRGPQHLGTARADHRQAVRQPRRLAWRAPRSSPDGDDRAGEHAERCGSQRSERSS